MTNNMVSIKSGNSLTESARLVLKALTANGPITRPQLGTMLGLSKPTMTYVVAELEGLGLVTSTGKVQGPMGRSAAIYELGQGAGYVIGMDVGSTRVKAVAHTLDGTSLASIEEIIPKQHYATIEDIATAIDKAAKAVIAEVGDRYKLLRSIAIAVPRIVSTSRLPQNRRKNPETVLQKLRETVNVPLLLENNVNCAAVGELHYGAAKNREIFIFLQVGVRIGLGIVLNGKLFRGFNGAAGEPGRLPFPWSMTELPVREGLEDYIGSEAFMQRCAAVWIPSAGVAPKTAKELFARAERGDEQALHWVNRHAADIGRVVAACIGFFDPGLVVLGGGVGQNPLVLNEVRRLVRELTWETDLAVSSLGEKATVLGAARIAADNALEQILGKN